MPTLRIGALYNSSKTSWAEGVNLRLIAGQEPELLLLFANPTPAEVEAIQRGKAQFAWIDSEHTAVLCYRFGDHVPWSDTPYTPHRERASDGTPGLPPGTGHQLVVVILVDATTGIVRALRQITWPPRFAGTVRKSVTRMLATPDSPEAADAAVDALYQRYPRTDDLVRQRADVTCTGGTGETGAPAPEASPTGRPEPAPTAGTPAALIAEHLGGYLVPGHTYPAGLPAELQPWYCYTSDGGHSIMVAIAAHYQPGADPAEFLAPAPVRAVTRAGWQVRDGFVVADLRYDPDLGLIADEADTEF
jgi:hypothetical protein